VREPLRCVLVRAHCTEGPTHSRHCLSNPSGEDPDVIQQQARRLRVDNDARTGMPFGIPKGAMCVQRFDDSLKFCNSHYLSHFAAFFIDARTKRSVVESFALIYFILQTTCLSKSFLRGPPTSDGPEGFDIPRRSLKGRARRSNRVK
jgi:hypothetical protein